MAGKETPDNLLREALLLLAVYGTAAEAAKHATKNDGTTTGLKASAFNVRLNEARTKGLEDDLPDAVKIDATPLAEKERRRLQDKVDRGRKEVRDANRTINRMEDLRKSLFRLTDEPLSPMKLDIKLDSSTSRGNAYPEIPIIFTSDFQWGEVVDIDQMGGLNSFDQEIAGRRYTRLIETALTLARKSNNGANPPRLVYLRGGDSISGEIHEELAKTNDLLSLPAVKDLAMHEAGGLEVLANELQCPIEVISVPGNHGRTTMKPQSKGYVDTSYDDVLSWFLEMYFTAKGDERITFMAPRSGDAFFNVYDTRFLLTHGDRIGSRGGQGFVGPAATIARGMKKLSDFYTSSGFYFDHILVGHFHTSLQLEHGWANGCLPGMSEFARDLRFKAKPPTQWYFSVHPRRGVVEQREIMVGGPGEGSLCELSD